MTRHRTPSDLAALREASRLTLRETSRRVGHSESHIRAVLAGKTGASPYILESLDHVIVSDALAQKAHLDQLVAEFIGGAA
ncbi:helix-turn-helix domain-containing protein [Corynebacterium hansenii]|uniref:Helix-turn-helix domain-containing protein n=1 Tax=Corynebacterium hansenii TaxID=394964 RepID=A0ABV7ZMZ7_9CORY|nr:helix-turn-helix domain-containing protein [Corynebacterium hansenii]WJY99316.1 hypothetical protein CHAN_03440 [Corynebacterium hansenii]